MRLDKFLKVSRLVKRRTLAKELCDQGRVAVNGKKAKAGTIVAVGDELSIFFGNKVVSVRIDNILTSVKKEDTVNLFSILEEKEATK